MRPTTILWLFSSVLLLANAAPFPPKSSALAKTKAPAATIPPARATVKPAVPAVQPTKATVKPVVQPPQATVKPTNATLKPTAAVPTNTLSKPAAATGVAKACPFKPGAKTGAKPPATKAPRGHSFEKRAPGTFTAANAPATITIKVDDKEFKLTKFGQQGKSGATYKVDGQAAFAKTNFKAGTITNEATVTELAGLLVASGLDTNCNDIQAEWLITKQVEGKPLSETKAFQDNKKDKEKCFELIDKAIDLVVTAATEFHTKTGGFNHNDLQPGNVLFDETVTKANLIDFGNARKGALKSPTFLRQFVAAPFASQRNLCI